MLFHSAQGSTTVIESIDPAYPDFLWVHSINDRYGFLVVEKCGSKCCLSCEGQVIKLNPRATYQDIDMRLY